MKTQVRLISLVYVLVGLICAVGAVGSDTQTADKGPYLWTYNNETKDGVFWQFNISDGYNITNGTPVRKMFVYRRGASVPLPATPIFQVEITDSSYSATSATFRGVVIMKGQPYTVDALFEDKSTDTATFTVTGPNDELIYKSHGLTCHSAVTKWKPTP